MVLCDPGITSVLVNSENIRICFKPPTVPLYSHSNFRRINHFVSGSWFYSFVFEILVLSLSQTWSYKQAVIYNLFVRWQAFPPPPPSSSFLTWEITAVGNNWRMCVVVVSRCLLHPLPATLVNFLTVSFLPVMHPSLWTLGQVELHEALNPPDRSHNPEVTHNERDPRPVSH